METDNSFMNKIFKEKWMPFMVIVVLGLILYFQAFFFDFSYLDDNNLILNNQYFLSNLANIGQSFVTDVFHLFNHEAFYYRPLLTISFMFDYQIGGASTFMYHITNVGLHILATCLLFIFLKKLDYRKELAFLFSIIFLVHPVLTQTVAWIPGRNDSLLAIFILTSFIFFLKHLSEGKVKDLVSGLIFFGLALFTKESALVAIPAMLFYLLFIHKENKWSFNKFYFFFGTILSLVPWIVLRTFTLRGSVQITFLNMIKSIYFNFPAVIQLVGKIFLPFNLSVLPIMQDTTFIYGIISIILLLVIIFLTKIKRWNFILFGSLWFFAFLLPSFIRPNPTLVADFIEHRLYVPIIGIFIIILETDLIKKIDFKKRSTLVITGGLILLFSVITLIHSRSFVDRLAFWENAVKNSPHYPLAHRNLGAMEYLDGDMGSAEKEYETALLLNPEEEMAHNNLGLIYANEGKLAEAEAEYKKELKINPYYDDAYYNLGLLYFKEEKRDEALDAWKKTLGINPNFAFPADIAQFLQSSASN